MIHTCTHQDFHPVFVVLRVRYACTLCARMVRSTVISLSQALQRTPTLSPYPWHRFVRSKVFRCVLVLYGLEGRTSIIGHLCWNGYIWATRVLHRRSPQDRERGVHGDKRHRTVTGAILNRPPLRRSHHISSSPLTAAASFLAT